MSTKNMRNALDAMVLADARLKPLADLALAEVENIEMAAKVIDENLCAQVFASNPDWVDAALSVLESIAREAP